MADRKDGVALERPAPLTYEQRWTGMERPLPFDFNGEDSPQGDFVMRSTTTDQDGNPQPFATDVKIAEDKGVVTDQFGIVNMSASPEEIAALQTARKVLWDLHRRWAELRKAELEKLVYSRLK